MATVELSDASQTRVSKQAVAKQFVRLYYSILNTHNGYLFQFYGKNSKVTLRETLEGKESLTDTAEDEESVKEMLHSVYSNVSVKVDSAVPQFSVDDCVVLHINGTMHRKGMDSRRAFTQAFVLCPQENGYYILTDLVHVLSFGHDRPLLTYWGHEAYAGALREGEPCVSSTSSETDAPLQLGSYQGSLPDDCQGQSVIRTATPPLEDAPRQASPESDHESEELSKKPWIARQLVKSMPPPVAPIMVAPPLAVPPMHVPTPSMAYSMMPPRYMRQRSMSMGCDTWPMQNQLGHGVFIARLPFGVQPADVEEAFSAFGPILGGREGIQVRDGRNGCYAFVTFEHAESARAAIQQGAVLQGKRVFIEPRYPRQDEQIMAYPPMMAPPMAYSMHVPAHIPRMP